MLLVDPLVRVVWRPSFTIGARPGQEMTHFQVHGGSLHTLPAPSSVVSPPPGKAEGWLGWGSGPLGLTADGEGSCGSRGIGWRESKRVACILQLQSPQATA
jgi:hypothetical protein